MMVVHKNVKEDKLGEKIIKYINHSKEENNLKIEYNKNKADNQDTQKAVENLLKSFENQIKVFSSYKSYDNYPYFILEFVISKWKAYNKTISETKDFLINLLFNNENCIKSSQLFIDLIYDENQFNLG